MCTLLSSQGPDAPPTRLPEGAPPEGLGFSTPDIEPYSSSSWWLVAERDPVRTASPGLRPGDRLGRSVLRLSGNEVQPYAEVNALPSGATSRACRAHRLGSAGSHGWTGRRDPSRLRQGLALEQGHHLLDLCSGKAGSRTSSPRRLEPVTSVEASRRLALRRAVDPESDGRCLQRCPREDLRQQSVPDPVRAPPSSLAYEDTGEQGASAVGTAHLAGHDAEPRAVLRDRHHTGGVGPGAASPPSTPVVLGHRKGGREVCAVGDRVLRGVLEPEGAHRPPVQLLRPPDGEVPTGETCTPHQQGNATRGPPRRRDEPRRHSPVCKSFDVHPGPHPIRHRTPDFSDEGPPQLRFERSSGGRQRNHSEPLAERPPQPRITATAPLVRLVAEEISDASCHDLMVPHSAAARHLPRPNTERAVAQRPRVRSTATTKGRTERARSTGRRDVRRRKDHSTQGRPRQENARPQRSSILRRQRAARPLRGSRGSSTPCG